MQDCWQFAEALASSAARLPGASHPAHLGPEFAGLAHLQEGPGQVPAPCLATARKTLATVPFGISFGGWGREKKNFNADFFSPFAYGGTDGPMIHKNCLQLNSHFAWLDLSVV